MTNMHFQSHYIPNTEQEQSEMLAAIGVGSVDDLFLDIPEEFRNPSLDLPAPLSELEIQRELAGFATKNRPVGSGRGWVACLPARACLLPAAQPWLIL